MKKNIMIFFIVLIFIVLMGCQIQHLEINEKKSTEILEVEKEVKEIYIQIEDYLCKTEFYQNKTTQELLKQFPKTYVMDEMNGNEKYNYIDIRLPTSSSKVNQIKAGDIMLFGDNCLVVFYKDFPTQYSYTKLGYIKDISEFLERLPKGQVELTFHKEF